MPPIYDELNAILMFSSTFFKMSSGLHKFVILIGALGPIEVTHLKK